MHLAKIFFNFYIDSSIHVALSVYALIRITFFKLHLPYDEPVAYFGFYGTIVGYNFIKYDALARVKRIKLTPTFKAIIGLSFFAALATLYYFFQLQQITKIFGFGALLITLLYTLPFIPKRTNMRNWAGVKIYLVALAWVVVTVWLPVMNADYGFDAIVLIKSVQRFILVFVLMLIFEIVDLQNDAESLQTIPQKIGVKRSKYLSYLLLVLFLLLDSLKPEITAIDCTITLVVSVILVLFTFFVSPQKSKYYTSFWVEAVPVFWWILLLING
ncbi:hypothetical protein [Flavobacterium sp.]|uniref:hypothetical protein n=1 Tax=Flavobacterium sp. TaxID=239 RepID=UPI0035298571